MPGLLLAKVYLILCKGRAAPSSALRCGELLVVVLLAFVRKPSVNFTCTYIHTLPQEVNSRSATVGESVSQSRLTDRSY